MLSNSQYDLDILIKGESVDFDTFLFDKISIIESAGYIMPAMQLNFYNDYSFIEDNIVSDGTPITIKLRIKQLDPQPDDFQVFNFRVFNYDWNEAESEGIAVVLYCIYDAPLLLQSRIKSYSGTSSEVFESIAEDAGLSVKVDESNDSQIWLQSGVRTHIFMNDVANHGWNSNRSCYSHCVTRQGKLQYVDVIDRLDPDKDPTWKFIRAVERDHKLEEDEIIYAHPIYKSNSGFFNSAYGYGRGSYSFDVHESDELRNDPEDLFKRTDTLLMKPSLRSSQRNYTYGFDSNNTHDKYYPSRAQNLQHKSTFSNQMITSIEYNRDLGLYDTVDVQARNVRSGALINATSGRYLIAGLRTEIIPASVNQYATLLRQGLNPLRRADYDLS